jgi:glucose uptake protein GlcU
LPRKLSKLSVLDYQYWLAVIVAPECVAVAIIARSPLWFRPDLVLWSFLCGPIWTLGSLSYSSAVDNVGVARSTPVKNLAPVFAAIYGIIIFREYTLANPQSLALAVSGVAMMCAAAFLIGRAGAQEHERAKAFDLARTEAERASSFRLGILYALGAAFFYGAYSVPLKFVFKSGVTAYSACAWLGIGVLASVVVIYGFVHKRVIPPLPSRREARIAQSAGAIWSSGQILGAAAMIYIPMSISWPVSNLSTLVAVAWGVWIFREVHIEDHWKDVVVGLVLYLTGLALLTAAAPSGHV